MVMMTAIIELQDIVKIYQAGDVEVRAVCGASLAIQQGEFAAIMDASGLGKSTLMNITSWTAWMYCACRLKNERKFGMRKLGLSFKDSTCWRALPPETTSICPCFMRNRRSAEKSSGWPSPDRW